MDPADRPRERLLVHGAAALSDVELVALVLGGGRSLARARALLDHGGGLAGLGRASAHELERVPGAGRASATAIAAAVELGRRLGRPDRPWTSPLRGPADAAELVQSSLRGATQEHFMVLGLDARQRVRLVHTVGIGSLAQVDVHPREVFRPLIRAGIHSVILAHNHPSGDPEPSDADVDLTLRMVDVGRLVGIPVLDHVVVTDGGHASLAALGLLPRA
jgi:DNA repair protein RadC